MESDNRKKVKGPIEVMPELDDPDGMKSGQEKKMPKVPKQGKKNNPQMKEEACNHTKKGVECAVHGEKSCP